MTVLQCTVQQQHCPQLLNYSPTTTLSHCSEFLFIPMTVPSSVHLFIKQTPQSFRIQLTYYKKSFLTRLIYQYTLYVALESFTCLAGSFKLLAELHNYGTSNCEFFFRFLFSFDFGQGLQRRKITCIHKSDHSVVSDQKCDQLPLPSFVTQSCNTDCELR